MPDEIDLDEPELSDLDSEPKSPLRRLFFRGAMAGLGLDEIVQPFEPSQIRVETKPMVISLLLDRIE